MEGHRQESQPYNSEWFKSRALAGLKQIEKGIWDYSDSLLLYVPGSDDKYESVQETDTPYNRLVTTPERNYLETIAPRVVASLPDAFDYVDLGPGTEHKEQFIFDAAKTSGKRIFYRPIDISDNYLRLSTEYAAKQGIEAAPLKSSFEEVAEKLGAEGNPRFVSIGLTYGNYNPSEILPLLKRIIAKNGVGFINAQIHERTDMGAIRSIYAEVATVMAAAKIRLLGLDPERDVSGTQVTDEVKVWYTLARSTPQLEALGVQAGDKLLVFQSLRPTLESLEQNISDVFPDYEILDTNGPFVGVLLK